MNPRFSTKKSAFTLIELIIVIAVIAILAAAVFVAIDPARRLNEARNARRTSDVATILEAVKKDQVDDGGTLLAVMTSEMTADLYYMIEIEGQGSACDTAAAATITCTGSSAPTINSTRCVDIGGDLTDNYLTAIPSDPSNATASQTGYYISRSSGGNVTVGACYPEQEGAGGSTTTVNIELTR